MPARNDQAVARRYRKGVPNHQAKAVGPAHAVRREAAEGAHGAAIAVVALVLVIVSDLSTLKTKGTDFLAPALLPAAPVEGARCTNR